MNLLFTMIMFFTGACLASFATLSAYRLGRGQLPWVPKRSYCDYCQKQLTYWQLIPIVGFLLQGGQCHFCQARLSRFSPLLETLSGFFFVQFTTGTLFSIINTTVLTLTFTFIIAHDYFYQLVYPVSFSGLLPLTWSLPNWHLPSLLSLLGAGCFVLILLLLHHFFHAIGGGDVEYIAILFLILGYYPTLIIILLSCLSMTIFFLRQRATRLPFLPALVTFTMLNTCLN